MAQLVEQVDDTDTDSVNFPLYRFESCPDYKLKKITKVLTFGDVRRYLYSHGSREPKHPNKSFIKNLVVSKLLLTFVKHISHRCMFERIYVCGFFFEKKSVKVFDKSKLKFYLCRRNKVHKNIERLVWVSCRGFKSLRIYP